MTDTPPSSTDRDAQITALIDRVAFLEEGDIEEITDAGDKLVIHHVDGDRTRVQLSETEQLSVRSIVRYTTSMPPSLRPTTSTSWRTALVSFTDPVVKRVFATASDGSPQRSS